MFFSSCHLILNCFALFSKKRQSKPTLPINLSFIKFCVARNFLGRTSPRWCSRGSPGGWIIFFTKLVDKYHRKIQIFDLETLKYSFFSGEGEQERVHLDLQRTSRILRPPRHIPRWVSSKSTEKLFPTVRYSRFHKKGTRSVHLFNGDYLSIPEDTGSCGYLFHEIPCI